MAPLSLPMAGSQSGASGRADSGGYCQQGSSLSSKDSDQQGAKKNNIPKKLASGHCKPRATGLALASVDYCLAENHAMSLSQYCPR